MPKADQTVTARGADDHLGDLTFVSSCVDTSAQPADVRLAMLLSSPTHKQAVAAGTALNAHAGRSAATHLFEQHS